MYLRTRTQVNFRRVNFVFDFDVAVVNKPTNAHASCSHCKIIYITLNENVCLHKNLHSSSINIVDKNLFVYFYLLCT